MAMLSSPQPGSAPAPWELRRWALLFVLAGNMLIDALEVSVVLVALPSIAADLGLTLWGVQWVMSGFALGFAAFLLLAPRVTARWGRRRVYLTALLVFTAASVAGGMTDSATVLIATRVVKGTCAALTAPTGLAIISTTFSQGPHQRRAVAVYSMFGAAGFTIGLLLSGALTGLSWRWTFLLPAPLALALLLAGLRLIPSDPTEPQPVPRWKTALLRNGALVRSALGAATLNGTYLALLLLITFQGQRQLDWTPAQTALALLPACLPLAVSVMFAARMVERFGTPRLIAAGALTPVLGHALYLLQPDPGSYLAVLPTLLLMGIGFMCAFAALNMQATSEIAVADRALAVPLYQTAVQLGAVLMLPLVAALAAHGHSNRPAALLITAIGAVGLITALTGLHTTRHRRRAT
ncbi:MFS transporter [Streptomyces sp. NPDC002845]